MQRISGLGHNRGEVVGPKSREEFQRALEITPGGSMRAAQFWRALDPNERNRCQRSSRSARGCRS